MAVTCNLSEDKLQAECFQWAWNKYPDNRQMLFHINNRSRNAIEGNLMKARGVCAGVSDMCLIRRNGLVTWLEFKTETGAQSDKQKDFEKKVLIREHEYIIIRTFNQFKEVYEEKAL
jgi:hypothetical protein